MITVWLLSVQLWVDNPPSIQIQYTKEYATYEECMTARAQVKDQKFQVLCLLKIKK